MRAPKHAFLLLLLLVALAAPAFASDANEAEDTFWYRVDPAGDVQIKLHVFWSETCPHCARARAFLETLGQAHPWLVIASYEVTTSTENLELFAGLASQLGEEIRGVPTFFLCGRMMIGFGSAETTGANLLAMAETCRDFVREETAVDTPEDEAATSSVTLPFLGDVGLDGLSLPILTVILGGLDAFNPCAFFVLLFLLSLLVHVRSRARMLLVGGVFVLFSGALYFVFMAAWLNLFLVLEEIRTVTLVAGVIAVVIALLGIKDFFLMRQGPTLSIPESAKQGLFARMRGLLSADSMPALLVGTVTLAVAANTYELLCTSGFPLVYTRALTLSELSPGSYYLYLTLYNVIYVAPLLAIVVAFTLTLGSRKLSEAQGRLLKLLSGLMMLGLGTVLIAAPDLLDNWLTAVGLLVGAVLVTLLAHLAGRPRTQKDASAG